MEKLAVEQKVQGSTYTPAGQTAQTQAANLGGFAYSFEELLQRVGARLDHAFASADQANLFMSNTAQQASDAPANDHADRRDSGSDRDTRSNDDDLNDPKRTDGATQRDDKADHGRDTGNSTESRSNDSKDSSSDGPEDGAREGNQADKDQGGREKDTDAKSSDSADNSGSDQNSDGGNENTANAKSDSSGNTDDTAAQQTAAVTAAAIYNAGKAIKGNGERVKSTDAVTAQQALRGNELAQAAAGQVAAKQSNKPASDPKGNNHQSANNAAAAANAAAQKAADGGNSAKVDPVQAQAQQLSRAIGPETQANIKVTVNNEQAQVTSKPTFTVANASVLTQDGGTGNQGNQQQAGQQQPGQQGPSTQQIQAAQLQAQAVQQAAGQTAQQAATSTGTTGPTSSGTGIQSGVSGQHSSGADALNNNVQNANSGQPAQNSQQTRDTQAQQQAQTAQRGQLPGSAVTEQISVKITKALQSGTDRISIQLKPAELGRVDVKLEMTTDGRVMTVVTAEKQDTLDLLRRDSSELQRALQEAGLKSGDMEFNLKGQEQQSADGENADNSNSSERETVDENGNSEDLDAGIVNAWESGIFMNGRLDVRA